MRDDKDRSSKWMIDHHGDGLLRLAGLTGFRSWRAIQPEEKANLYAVAQVMTRLRYNDPRLLALQGGRRVMIESPLIQELWAEKAQEYILRFLAGRFGAIPAEIAAALRAVQAEQMLGALVDWAARRPDLDAFRSRLPRLNVRPLRRLLVFHPAGR